LATNFGARNLAGVAGHARRSKKKNKRKESSKRMKILDIPQSGKRGLNVS
jgi:hypothetical protein